MPPETPWKLWWIIAVFVIAVFVIALLIWLIGLICELVRDQLNENNSSLLHPNSETCSEVTGARPSTMTFRKVTGLRNLGNTCYFNAAIQCLCHTTILGRKVEESLNAGNLATQFIQLLYAMRYESNSPISPVDFHSVFCTKVPKFNGNQQHDSHEFLRNFLDELRKDEGANPEFDLSFGRSVKLVDQIFGGHYITVYTCTKCGAPHHLCEPILDMSLPVRFHKAELLTETSSVSLSSDDPYRIAVKRLMTPLSEVKLRPSRDPDLIESTQTGKRTINDCLRYFTRVEHIKDDYLCKDCSRKHAENGHQDRLMTSATKQTLIFNPPAILTIHLKRFELRPGQSRKVNDMVNFDELLDIGPYCSSWCMRNDDPSMQNLWYSLYGVVVHQSGYLTSGHYVAFVRVREEEQGFEKFLQKKYFDRDVTAEQLVEMMEKFRKRPTAQWQRSNTKGVWYLVNDSAVSRVAPETVLKQEAYLLFYERLVHL